MRIKNEKQYATSRTLLERFRGQVEAERAGGPAAGVHPKIHNAIVDGIESEIRSLESSLAEYERIKAGASEFEVGSLADIPMVLVKARVSRGWSQAELARRMQIAEQQIQRYEQNEYAGVSFDRLREIARVLGVSVRGEARLSDENLDETGMTPWRPAAIAMLLDAVQSTTGHALLGRTRLQKMLTVWGDVLAEELGTPVFTPLAGNYGGFDQEVNDDVDFLEAGGLVRVGSDTGSTGPTGSPLQRAIRRTRAAEPNEEYELTKDGLEWLRTFLASQELSQPEKKEHLRQLVKAVAVEFGSLSLDELIEQVYAKYPELTVNSRIKDRVLARIRRRASR
jgi:HTH-type transcriptional regulator/antitoxin HigA